ncbi:MAG TPA: fasciclin domain-containing protein [Kamptonema sp.]|nr:fasciclin domain-containing protein [Kamptonema sp.]
MNTRNLSISIKRLTGLAGLVGASALIGFPAWANLNSKAGVNSEVSAIALSAPTTGTSVKIAAAPQDIVATASANANFKTLTKALTAAGLVTTLKGKGPFTVFAPTDAAFAALPKSTLDDLLKPANKAKLTKILTYHVVPGEHLSASLKTGNVKTVEGSPVKVAVNGKNITVGNAKVTQADIKTTNGVIHVIDKVLMPPDVK